MLKGDVIHLEWETVMDTAISMGFTRPNGERLLQTSKEPIVGSGSALTVWGLYPLNPWLERINDVIFIMVESGLIRHWKETTRVGVAFHRVPAFNFRNTYFLQASFKKSLPLPVEEQKVAFAPKDVKGIFGLFALTLACGALIFLWEKMSSKRPLPLKKHELLMLNIFG